MGPRSLQKAQTRGEGFGQLLHEKPPVEQISELAKERGLVLFVGAGINGECAPQWYSILQSLLESGFELLTLRDASVTLKDQKIAKKWCQRKSKYDLCAQAVIAKQLLGDRYVGALYETIYDENKLREADFQGYCARKSMVKAEGYYGYLRQTAELCQSRHVRAVVSFNYDSFLEESIDGNPQLARLPAGWESEREKPAPNLADRVPIYHVHGFLPRQKTWKPNSEDPILAIDEYLRLMRNPMAWQTTTPLHLLSQHCCLFIGTSFRDWNMLRLAEAINQQPQFDCYQLMAAEDLGKCLIPLASRVHATMLEAVGVKPVIAGEHRQDVRSYLQELTRTLNETDSKRV
jgi:hypothetical protein